MGSREGPSPGGADSLPGVRGRSLQALQQLVRQVEPHLLPRLIFLLEEDSRSGCASLAARARRRWERLRVDRRRFHERFRYERRLWRWGLRGVAGVDEAGRGPLAGPVVAAAVILDPDVYLHGLDDSKVLTEAGRDRLAREISRTAVAVSVARVPVGYIDRHNIHQASLEAMRRAVAGLHPQPGFVLVDGFRVAGLTMPQLPLVRGDGLSNSIAAASVLAKVHRDRLMMALDRQYPHYGFSRHKGYPTREHREALRRHGPCPQHRRSFTLEPPAGEDG